MKRIILAALALVAFGAAQAQPEYRTTKLRPMAGIAIYSLWGGEGASPNANVGIVAGAEMATHFSVGCGLNAGVMFSQTGFDYDVEYERYSSTYIDNVKAEIKSINVPLTFNLYLTDMFVLKAGLQPSFCLSSKLKDMNGTHRNQNWNSFDMSLPVGVSYEYRNFCLDIRYNIGLTETWEGTDTHSHSLTFTLGYDLPL